MTLTPSVRAISLCSFPCVARSFASASFVAISTLECLFFLTLAACIRPSPSCCKFFEFFIACYAPQRSASYLQIKMKAVRYPRDFKPELYPQKHGQEDQDRVQHDPHNVGSPTPSLVYSLLAHGEFSLASHAMVSPLLSLPPNGWTGPWDKPELF